MSVVPICLYFIISCLFSRIDAIAIGSNTAFSRQAAITFPATDTDNTMLGFASFPKGFTLASKTTTCTYDGFLPISGSVIMNGGRLYLRQDLVISNSCDLINGGEFYGNHYSMEFGKHISEFTIPAATPAYSISLTASARATIDSGSRNAIAWSKDDTYIAVGGNVGAGPELRVYYFDGATLTSTLTRESDNVDGLAWNPKSNYLALAANNGAVSTLQIYRHTVSNGTFVVTDSDTPPLATAGVGQVAWHQSGNFLAVTTDNGASDSNFVVYPFSQVTGLLGTPITLSTVANSMRRVAWAPGGNFLAYSSTNNAGTGEPELFITSFNGTSLTITASADLGEDIHAADWSPTGTYIAVGTGTSIRIYSYIPSPVSLLEVQGARTTGLPGVGGMVWDRTGSFILAGTEGGASASLNLYAFDSSDQTLTLLNSFADTANIDDVSWSHSNRFSVYEMSTTQIVVTTTSPVARYVFRDTDIVLNNNVNIAAPVKFQGNCKVDGRGKKITFQTTGEMVVAAGSSLTFEDIELAGLDVSRLRCQTDRASITLKNTILNLSADYTFSRGSMLFDDTVLVTGSSKFNYTTGLSSTIASGATLMLDRNVTFSYQPRRPRNNLVTMLDSTSCLYLNGCTVHSTRTGLALSTGTMIIDSKVTFSSEARSRSEALLLSSNLSAKLRGDAVAEFFGLVRYD